MKDVEGFDWHEYPLRAAPVHLWEGFIFVYLGMGTPTPFEELYAPLLGRFVAWNLRELRSHKRITYEVKSNWKYIFQNFNECYHCPTIHPMLTRLTDITSGNNDLIEGPFLGGYMDILNESMTVSGRLCSIAARGTGRECQARLLLLRIAESAAECSPRLRDVPPGDAPRPGPKHDRQRVAVQSARHSTSRAFIRKTQWTSGTRPTCRTGTYASWGSWV